MKRLIVNAGIDWIDRKEIKPMDAIICRSPDDKPYICIWTVRGERGFWSVISWDRNHNAGEADSFIDFFTDKNSTGKPFNGWKFYKVDDGE